MKPCRELDALVAEKVMGLSIWRHGRRVDYKTDDSVYNRVPSYSTDIAAAWQVVERIRNNEVFHAECDDLIGLSRQTATNAARIICVAALKAVEEAS